MESILEGIDAVLYIYLTTLFDLITISPLETAGHQVVNSGFDEILCIYIYISMTYGAYEKITTWGRVSEKKKKKILKKQVVYNEPGKKGVAYNEL